MKGLIKKLKQFFCNHQFYIEDLKRHIEDDFLTYENLDNRVSCNCHKCGKVFFNSCGLNITTKWKRMPK